MGSDEAKHRWVEEKVETWVAGVKHLAGFAILFTQVDYSVLKMSLQHEWQFIRSVPPRVGPLFAPLESELGDEFILTLIGVNI